MCLEWRGHAGSFAFLPSFVGAPELEAAETLRVAVRLKLPDSKQNLPQVLLPSLQTPSH